MRSPDEESEAQGSDSSGSDSTESGSGGAISPLADGFAGDGGDDGGGDESAFGSGWPSSSDSDPDNPFSEPAFGAQPDGYSDDEGFDFGSTSGAEEFEDFSGAEDAELSSFEFEPDYVPDTDTDWDVTGDGVVDHSDFHEAATALTDFHVDPADSHGHAQNEGFFHTE